MTAVVLNVTATEPTAAGDIVVYGDGTARPSSSNVNFVKGQTVPNQVIAPVGADGKVDFYNASTGTTDLIADVAGYFTQTSSSGYSSLTPYRLVDTRVGTGEPKRPLAGKGSFAVQIAGNDGGKLPASGITAVALNITSTASAGSGFLTAYGDGANRPTASNVNFSHEPDDRQLGHHPGRQRRQDPHLQRQHPGHQRRRRRRRLLQRGQPQRLRAGRPASSA